MLAEFLLPAFVDPEMIEENMQEELAAHTKQISVRRTIKKHIQKYKSMYKAAIAKKCRKATLEENLRKWNQTKTAQLVAVVIRALGKRERENEKIRKQLFRKLLMKSIFIRRVIRCTKTYKIWKLQKREEKKNETSARLKTEAERAAVIEANKIKFLNNRALGSTSWVDLFPFPPTADLVEMNKLLPGLIQVTWPNKRPDNVLVFAKNNWWPTIEASMETIKRVERAKGNRDRQDMVGILRRAPPVLFSVQDTNFKLLRLSQIDLDLPTHMPPGIYQFVEKTSTNPFRFKWAVELYSTTWHGGYIFSTKKQVARSFTSKSYDPTFLGSPSPKMDDFDPPFLDVVLANNVGMGPLPLAKNKTKKLSQKEIKKMSKQRKTSEINENSSTPNLDGIGASGSSVLNPSAATFKPSYSIHLVIDKSGKVVEEREMEEK
jgi:hypothetical protein